MKGWDGKQGERADYRRCYEFRRIQTFTWKPQNWYCSFNAVYILCNNTIVTTQIHYFNRQIEKCNGIIKRQCVLCLQIKEKSENKERRNKDRGSESRRGSQGYEEAEGTDPDATNVCWWVRKQACDVMENDLTKRCAQRTGISHSLGLAVPAFHVCVRATARMCACVK